MDRSPAGPGDRLEVKEQLAPVGAWRRWTATLAEGLQGGLLLSRLDADGVQVRIEAGRPEGAAPAISLRHPALAPAVGGGSDGAERWVLEEIGRARPLADPRCRPPRGERLARSLLQVLEALAYLHRQGICHGHVSRGTLVSDGREVRLTGAALGLGRETGVEACAGDVQAWARMVLELLGDRSAGEVSRALVHAAKRVLDGRMGGRSARAFKVARAVRASIARGEQGTATADAHGVAGSTGGGGMRFMAGVLYFLGSLVIGTVTTVLTVALLAAVVTVGAVSFLERLPQEVQVPNVVGLKQAEAEARLEQRGLGVGHIRNVYRNDVDTGEVAAVIPEPGMTVREGREVTLVVSLGAAQVEVPRLVGLHLDEARKLLEQRDLVLTEGGKARSSAPLGEIVRQNPSAGERVARGERVSVQVSGGPRFGLIEVEREDGETVRVFFRRIRIVIPRGDPLQRVQVREGYGGNLTTTYDRLHRPGDHIDFDTSGRAGKQIEVSIEGERVFRTQL